MGNGIPFSFFFIVSEKWEFRDPEEIEFLVSFENVLEISAAEADATEDFTDRFPFTCAKEDQVAGFDIEFFTESFDFGIGHALDER